jgi:hypothetical protein
MSGPQPTFRPCFPPDFLEQAHTIVHQRTAQFQVRQRATLVLLLHEDPTLSNVEAGRHVQLHADSVRDWRRRWCQGNWTLEDRAGRGRKPTFSPPR